MSTGKAGGDGLFAGSSGAYSEFMRLVWKKAFKPPVGCWLNACCGLHALLEQRVANVRTEVERVPDSRDTTPAPFDQDSYIELGHCRAGVRMVVQLHLLSFPILQPDL